MMDRIRARGTIAVNTIDGAYAGVLGLVGSRILRDCRRGTVTPPDCRRGERNTALTMETPSIRTSHDPDAVLEFTSRLQLSGVPTYWP